MRRIWSYIVAVVLLGLVVWNVISGQAAFGANVPGAALVLIAFTLSWWFETDRHSS